MNQELIDMAEQATTRTSHQYQTWGDRTATHIKEDFDKEKFAALVAAAEREKFCVALRQLHDSYSLASRSNNIRTRGETK